MRFMKLMVDQRNSELLLIRVMSFVSCRAASCFFCILLFQNTAFCFIVKKNRDEMLIFI